MPPTKKRSKNKRNEADTQSENKPTLPHWPKFEPKPFVEDLSLHALYPDQIVTIPRFWTSSLCEKYVTYLSTLPLVTTPGKPKRGEAVRVNDRYQIDDPVFAECLWSETGLKDLVLDGNFDKEADIDSLGAQQRLKKLWGGTPIGLNPNIRIYRYSKGQFFDQHCK